MPRYESVFDKLDMKGKILKNNFKKYKNNYIPINIYWFFLFLNFLYILHLAIESQIELANEKLLSMKFDPAEIEKNDRMIEGQTEDGESILDRIDIKSMYIQ